MRSPYLITAFAVVLASVGTVACRGGSATGDDVGGDGGVDAPDGVGCTAMSPRSVEPEAFVGPTGLQPRLTALIDSAQTSLDVQMYLFTVKPLADRIVAAKQRGVAVRVILDPDEAGNAAVMPIFSAGQVAVRQATTLYPFSHAKYLVIDGKSAVIMSMNFNIDAMSTERNYGIVDKDPEDVADVEAVFRMDWAAAGNEPVQAADLTCTRLIVSPVNAKQRILELIASAHATLEVEAFYVTDTTMRNAIGAAAQRGVTVRVILESASDQPANADTAAYFKGLGIPVHYAMNEFYLHAKLIVADGVAFVGSQNFSTSGISKNREMGALVFEPTQAQVMTTQFETDFAATSPAP